MRPLSELSIRQKLMRVSMLASSTALLSASIAFVLYDVATMRETVVAQSTTSAELVGATSVAALLFDDPEAATKTLSALSAQPHVTGAVLYTRDGRTFARYQRPGSGFVAPPGLPAAETYRFSAGRVQVFRAVELEGERVGTVLVESDLQEIGERLQRYLGIVALVSLGAFAVALVISARFQRAIAEPLLRLAETARVVSRDKDYSVRAEGGGAEEVGLLTGTFNEMLAAIEQRDAELNEARTSLEQRVEERTLALQRELAERKRAEEALRKSQLLLAESQRLAHVGSWEWDTASGLMTWSEELFRVLGLDGGETPTLDLMLSRVHSGDRAAVEAALRRAKETRESFHLEHRIVRPDGERVIFAYGRVLEDDASSPRVVGTAQDVTERKAAEEERAQLIREQAARAEAESARRRSAFLADLGSALAGTLDYEATLATVARRVLGPLGDWCAVHFIEDGQPRLVAVEHADPTRKQQAWALVERWPFDARGPFWRAVKERRAVLETSIPLTREDDVELVRDLRALGFASAIVAPLSARGEVFGAVTFVAAHRPLGDAELSLAESVAESAALAIDSARLYRDAQQANRMKDEFLATLSHELRTPLNAIVGWAKLLQSGQLDEAMTQRAVEVIDRNARAQTQLIEDILDVSRIVTGKLQLDPRAVDLTAVVEAALDSVRPAAEAKEIDLSSDLEATGPVLGDANRLQQVVWNLLSNAIKFTPRQGRVTVTVSRDDGHVEVAVSDTGQGIRPEFLPHVFERFRQADSSSTRSHGGLGLGLAIVRHLVELHGGTVVADSGGEGHGATFTVRLPLRREPALDPRPESGRYGAGDLTPSLDGIKVLVVDDERDSRELVCTVLERLGALALPAASAEEALATLTRERPDVMLSDIEMPGVDGYALLREVRALSAEEGGDVPAAALTAYARREDARAALRAGFQVHLSKPVGPRELAVAVYRLASPRRRASPARS